MTLTAMCDHVIPSYRKATLWRAGPWYLPTVVCIDEFDKVLSCTQILSHMILQC